MNHMIKSIVILSIFFLLGIDIFLRYEIWKKPLLIIPEQIETHCENLGFTGYSYKLSFDQEKITIRCGNYPQP